MQLTQALFSKDYLGGLENVVAYYIPFRGLPMASKLEWFITLNEEVAWHPLLSGLKTMALSSHRYRVKLAAEFLLHVHLIIPVPEGTDWYTRFRDYIFLRILMPYQQPNLVVIFMSGKLQSASNSEWLGEEENSDADEGETEESR